MFMQYEESSTSSANIVVIKLLHNIVNAISTVDRVNLKLKKQLI